MIEPDDLEEWISEKDDKKIDLKRDVKHRPGEAWMTSAQLKCVLGWLGASPGWFAARCETTLRTVVRWCDGHSPIPESAIAELEKIVAHTEATLVSTLASVDQGCTTVLRTYRTDDEFWVATGSAEYPASWHRMIVARMMDQLLCATSHVVRIEYEDT